MGIGNFFKKVLLGNPSKVYDKITPDQMELKTYINQEKRDVEKALLAEFRKKNTNLMDTNFYSGNNILNAKDVFMGKNEKKKKKVEVNNNLFIR